jgi:aspartate kinase
MNGMKSVIVQKFGGVCLESPEKIKQVAASIAQLSKEGHGVVAVVSAMGKTTDGLVKLAYEVSAAPNRRELDMLLTTGERVSMALMSMALTDLGCRAISFTGSQAGVMTDGSHSNARIIDIRPIRIEEELQRGSVIVLAGFQGVNPETKEITTLGRGGTDTTAVAMAVKLRASRCDIVKEVDGVCSADPQLVPNAKRISKLTYAALREMCFWGAKVLHYRSVELAEQTHVPLFIRRWGHDGRFTEIVKEDLAMELCQILSVNSHARIEHFEVEAPTLNQAFLLFEKHLQTKMLPRPQILASAMDAGKTRLMLTGDEELLESLMASIAGHKQIRTIKKTLSSVTVTCHGSIGSDVPSKVMSCLESEGIAVDKVLFTPLSVTVCVDPHLKEAAIRALHNLVERK